jgi:hypothetical protein
VVGEKLDSTAKAYDVDSAETAEKSEVGFVGETC